jgi:hypothetical protein|tara:strand:- start:139 stop:333 length:195 start_codon:yes stop_codon:yes gene_type:complete
LVKQQEEISLDAKLIANALMDKPDNVLFKRLQYYIQKTYEAFPLVKLEDNALLLRDDSEYIPDD